MIGKIFIIQICLSMLSMRKIEMNKCLALLRNVYDDDHGFEITVTEQNGNIYSKYYRMIDYLKAYKYFEYASNHFILKGDHRIYHKDVKIDIVNIYVR